MKPITPRTLVTACKALALHDPALGRIHATLGPPPMWQREPGFATLVHIILEQQVSLASALAALNKLRLACSSITPGRFLGFNDEALKTFGFSRQKARYCRLLAEAVQSRALDLDSLPALNDDAVRAALTSITGIGIWTANIYLLMVLLRADVWPLGDIALQTAWQRLNGHSNRPSATELEVIAERWVPHRAVAARLLWHYYLSGMPPSGAK